MEIKTLVVTAPQRLDTLLATQGLTRSRAAALIKEGLVFVQGKQIDKPSFVPNAQDTVVYHLADAAPAEAQPQDLPLDILYQDEDIAVVYKPCGMVVHPAAGNLDGTLVNALLFHLSGLSGIGGQMRPGIVHRLDKDTSGVMLVAKNDTAHVALSAQLANRQMEKHYYAVVAGRMKEQSGTVDAPIARSPKDRKKMAVVPGGRSALSHWQVIQQRADSALLDVHIVSGRTHQIRVHMASIHHPVLGDPLYGNPSMPKAPRLMLHAFSLAFTHPTTGERLCFTCPAPKEFGLA